jgi:hypothetical protein
VDGSIVKPQPTLPQALFQTRVIMHHCVHIRAVNLLIGLGREVTLHSRHDGFIGRANAADGSSNGLLGCPTLFTRNVPSTWILHQSNDMLCTPERAQKQAPGRS